MTYEQVCAEQAKEIMELKETLKNHQEAFSDIYSSLYAIGAPLNDNCLAFNKEQRKYLSNRIADSCEAVNWGKPYSEGE